MGKPTSAQESFGRRRHGSGASSTMNGSEERQPDVCIDVTVSARGQDEHLPRRGVESISVIAGPRNHLLGKQPPDLSGGCRSLR